MTKKFGINKSDCDWIRKVCAEFLPGARVSVFGSRSRGDFREYSDLDLAIESKVEIHVKIWLELKEQFSQSSLPFKVDLVDLSKIDPEFLSAVKPELKEL